MSWPRSRAATWRAALMAPRPAPCSARWVAPPACSSARSSAAWSDRRSRTRCPESALAGGVEPRSRPLHPVHQVGVVAVGGLVAPLGDVGLGRLEVGARRLDVDLA